MKNKILKTRYQQEAWERNSLYVEGRNTDLVIFTLLKLVFRAPRISNVIYGHIYHSDIYTALDLYVNRILFKIFFFKQDPEKPSRPGFIIENSKGQTNCLSEVSRPCFFSLFASELQSWVCFTLSILSS